MFTFNQTVVGPRIGPVTILEIKINTQNVKRLLFSAVQEGGGHMTPRYRSARSSKCKLFKILLHDCVCGSPHVHIFMSVSLSCVMLYYPPALVIPLG